MSINVMHAKSGLRVLLQWKIYRPDSVITAVITLKWTFDIDGTLLSQK